MIALDTLVADQKRVRMALVGAEVPYPKGIEELSGNSLVMTARVFQERRADREFYVVTKDDAFKSPGMVFDYYVKPKNEGNERAILVVIISPGESELDGVRKLYEAWLGSHCREEDIESLVGS